MKKYLFAGSLVIIAAAVFLAANFYSKQEARITAPNNIPVQEKQKEKKSCCSDMPAEEFSENSIYQLESAWVNQDGRTAHLSDFKGKPVVLTMFFASCTYACPILVEDMKKIERQLSPADLNKYQFVLVSIDPERDTPEKLKAFAEAKNLDLKRWTLLRGKKDSIMELAALLGFNFRKESDGQFSHSNLINILNDEGEIKYQHTGLNQDITIAANHLQNGEESL